MRLSRDRWALPGYPKMMNKMMRAVVITAPGDPGVLRIREVPRPVPGPGEALIRIAAAGVNRADLLQRRGRYPAPPGYPQDILGLEFSGEVEAAEPSSGSGSPAGHLEVGSRVMGITGGGSYAEYLVAPLGTLLPVPDALSLTEGAALPEAFATAYDALFPLAGLSQGETLLVHAAGSGVATAAVQLARVTGATTIGTSRSPWKLDRARELGLDHGVAAGHGDPPWADRVLDLTEGRGANVIMDLVGAPYLGGNQDALAVRGRHVVVGVPGGPKGEIDLRRLMTLRAQIIGTVLRARPLAEKEALTRLLARHVIPGLASGDLHPVIDRSFPMTAAAAAHAHMEANRNFGKIVLEWG